MDVKIKDSTLSAIADAIRVKNKEADKYKPSEMPDAIDRIIVTEMVIEPKEITANGTYEVPEGVHGYNPITVEVPPDLESITITENGTYVSENADGFSEVTVNTPTLTAEDLVITGDCGYRFANNGWNAFIEKFGDKITTKDITNAQFMFNYCTELENIPFQINVGDSTTSLTAAFTMCQKLTSIPNIRGTIEWNTGTSLADSLRDCYNIRDFENIFTSEMLEEFSTVKVTSAFSCPKHLNFDNCRSMRNVPSWWYNFRLNEESTIYPYTGSSYCLYCNAFQNCYALDEITNIPVWRCQAAQTSNMFSRSFSDCVRVKNVTFETNEDGTPIVTQWKAQVIDLSSYVGYCGNSSHVLNYNSGITADKAVTDAESYQRLKDDPDWYAYELSMTQGIEYSRYNHDSAVETINSLPDTSAYLATAGGTNTIKFKGIAGLLTDGGAINTLTDDEKDVAALKGWTVQIV